MAWRPHFPAGASRYRLSGGRLLSALIDPLAWEGEAETIAADLLIEHGRIAAITPPGGLRSVAAPEVDLAGGLVLPCPLDAHTHLDKGFIWPRRPNPHGTFATALAEVGKDRPAGWSAADLRRRMEFGLRTAFAHGTCAMRTHLDCVDRQTAISWPVFAELREAWRGRIELQAASLFSIDRALVEPEFSEILAAVVGNGGVLGAVTYMLPELEAGLDRMFQAAAVHGLDLDFHVDETHDPAARSLAVIAETAIRHRFAGKILVGHCTSLARQDHSDADRTMDRVAEAGIAVVSLPMCNLYLQDRQAGRTPRWRGVTLLHELARRGVPVMAASDNVRDPFFAYGDLDMLEVFSAAVRILHLDAPFAAWPRIMACAPAELMRLPGAGSLRVGATCDLVLCNARSLNELLSRSQADRIVLRSGRPIDTAPPDYRELDDLMGVPG